MTHEEALVILSNCWRQEGFLSICTKAMNSDDIRFASLGFNRILQYLAENTNNVDEVTRSYLLDSRYDFNHIYILQKHIMSLIETSNHTQLVSIFSFICKLFYPRFDSLDSDSLDFSPNQLIDVYSELLFFKLLRWKGYKLTVEVMV